MILIFDTYSGLCNQFLDIQSSVNFSSINNFKFTFRHCSFRKKNIKFFQYEDFSKLFNINSFKNLPNYIDYHTIKDDINKNNTFNLEQKRSIELFNNENELINFIKSKNFKYYVLPQFFSIAQFNKYKNYYLKIKPNPRLYSIFLNLKKHLLPKKYNFIHYRYENDFCNYFQIKHIISIDSLLNNLKFRNNKLKVYIACSNLKDLSKTLYLSNDLYSYKNILSKDDHFIKYKLNNLNFEEKAFIDFLIGINANQVYGHSKSSFSNLINLYNNSNNYYDIL